MSYRIVVAVSARAASPNALRWALEEAAAHDGEVVALRTWRPLPPAAGSRGTPSQVLPDHHAAEDEIRRRLERDLAGVLGPDHQVAVLLAQGGKRRGILGAAADADLLVMEAPRPRDTTGPGFVSRLTADAPCPVVVVPRSDSASSHRRFGRRTRRGTQAQAAGESGA